MKKIFGNPENFNKEILLLGQKLILWTHNLQKPISGAKHSAQLTWKNWQSTILFKVQYNYSISKVQHLNDGYKNFLALQDIMPFTQNLWNSCGRNFNTNINNNYVSNNINEVWKG